MSDKLDKELLEMMRRLDPSMADALEKNRARKREQATFGSPYAIICREHGKVLLTEVEYKKQMDRPNALWRCPKCGEDAAFDDDHYESMLGLGEPEE